MGKADGVSNPIERDARAVRRRSFGLDRVLFGRVLFGIAALACVVPTTCRAESQAFIRFSAQIAVSRTAAAAMPVDTSRGQLVVTSHIAAFSQQTGFGGDVVSRFDADDDRYKPLWSEPVCHQDRGFPRLDVIHVAGSQAVGGESVDASKRMIGKPVPVDELYLDQRNSSYAAGQKVYYYRTSASKFLISVRLTRILC